MLTTALMQVTQMVMQQQHALQAMIAVHGSGSAAPGIVPPSAGSLTAAATGVGSSVLSAAEEAAQHAAQSGASGATVGSTAMVNAGCNLPASLSKIDSVQEVSGG